MQYLVGYGAKVHIAGPNGNTPLHLVLGKQDMKPLSEWSTYLNEVQYIHPCNTRNFALLEKKIRVFSNSSMSTCQELTTVFRMSLCTSLWPVSWSVKEPVSTLCLTKDSLLSVSVQQNIIPS